MASDERSQAAAVLEVSELELEVAQVRLEVAQKKVKLARLKVELAATTEKLRRLRIRHSVCPSQQIPASVAQPSSPDGSKRARVDAPSTPEPQPSQQSSSPQQGNQQDPQQAGPASASASPVASGSPHLEAARRSLLAARGELDALEVLFNKTLEEQERTDATLITLRSEHRRCGVDTATRNKWRRKKLEVTPLTVFDKFTKQKFEGNVAKAPCLHSLHLDFGGDFNIVPASLVLALSQAPADIRELHLAVGAHSEAAVLALLGRTKDHLRELTADSLPSFGDAALRRMWALLETSSIARLTLPPQVLRAINATFMAGGFPLLQRLSFRVQGASRDAAVDEAAEALATLPLLLRACASTLRAVLLPWRLARHGRRELFAALTACRNLEELAAPFCQEVALLTNPRLSRLSLVHSREDAPQGSTSYDAALRFLRLRSTTMRLRRLALADFRLAEPDTDEGPVSPQPRPIADALCQLKLLDSLTLDRCDYFGGVLPRVLASLPRLRELRLLRFLYLDDVMANIVTPDAAPVLAVLELDYLPSQDVDEENQREMWATTVQEIRDRFHRQLGTALRVRLSRDGVVDANLSTPCPPTPPPASSPSSRSSLSSAPTPTSSDASECESCGARLSNMSGSGSGDVEEDDSGSVGADGDVVGGVVEDADGNGDAAADDDDDDDDDAHPGAGDNGNGNADNNGHADGDAGNGDLDSSGATCSCFPGSRRR